MENIEKDSNTLNFSLPGFSPEKAISDGYEFFISGFADGTDLIAAEAVLKLQQKYPHIHLIGAIPYKSRLKALLKLDCFNRCSDTQVVCEEYVPECYSRRNRFMVDSSSLVIAVTDGKQTGGTAYTINYALKKGRELYIIRFDPQEE